MPLAGADGGGGPYADAMTPDFRLSGITLDCRDPEELADFWHRLLGGTVTEPLAGWRRIVGHGGGPQISFQPVPEPKLSKVRLHLDLTVDDVDRALERVVELGGRWLGQWHQYGEGVVAVVADPEGNEFCLVRYVEATPSSALSRDASRRR
jgi:predicted enzyme related to lactoylglutathione lyase